MLCQIFSSGTLTRVVCRVKYFALEPFEELSLLIKATYRESERQLAEAFQSLGITPAQAEVLLVLQQAEPLSLGELGDLLVAEGGHPSRLVDRLVRAGYVRRQADLGDRRRIEISLTEPRARYGAASFWNQAQDAGCRAIARGATRYRADEKPIGSLLARKSMGKNG